MTTTELYQRITLPTRYRVFGLRLVPFTVGHARLFARLELDEINDGAGCLLAAKLCSMPADRAERWITSRLLGARMLLLSLRRRDVVRDPEAVNHAVKVFGEYLDEGTRAPAFQAVGEEGERLGTPFAQHLRVVLLSKLNYRPDEVDRTPYLQAMWDYVSYLESEGRVRIPEGATDEQESALLRQADELLARVKEGKL